MRKILVALVVLLVLITIIVLKDIFFSKMIDENADMQSVGIVFCGSDKEYKPTEREIIEIRDLLSETRKTRKKFFPSKTDDSERPQWDDDFMIIVDYVNGKTETYYATEANNTVYKYIRKGSELCDGYMLGTNEKLCLYLRKMYSEL